MKNQKKYAENFQISAYDSTFYYALKQEMIYEQTLDNYLNIQYLYKIEAN